MIANFHSLCHKIIPNDVKSALSLSSIGYSLDRCLTMPKNIDHFSLVTCVIGVHVGIMVGALVL